MFIGKEFGDLMSSSYSCKRIGGLLYRNKCDPYVMLSHALGATKTTCNVKSEAGAISVQQVGSHLNEKVHDLSASIIAKYV